MSAVLETVDRREQEARLAVFAEAQASAAAEQKAEDLSDEIASTRSSMEAATAELRSQLKELQAQIHGIEGPFQERLARLREERAALLESVVPQDELADRIRATTPAWLREVRQEFGAQVDALVRRREELKYRPGIDDAERRSLINEVEAELLDLNEEFARIDHVAANVVWPGPEDLAVLGTSSPPATSMPRAVATTGLGGAPTPPPRGALGP